MKHIYIKFISSTVLLASMACPLVAQETIRNEAPKTESADSLVQVAFRKISQDELLGGVSVIDFKELQKKNYNTYTLDNLQGYVGGWNGNSLWGMDGDNAGYLVLVDGIPRSMDNVLPSEIDQITFLKGASAVVLYGSRAAKGVIYITTKRGQISDKLQIDVRANTGFYVPKSYPKYLGSAEYMTLYNEALANDGLAPLYSDSEIYNSAMGINPYRYPNLDYYSGDYLKKAYNRSDVTAEFSGGNQRARYYANIGYYRQGDLFKFGQVEDNYTSRLNIRGNVDLTINDFISAYANANATFYDARTGVTTDEDEADYWEEAAKMRPNRFSPLIPVSYIDPNYATGNDYMAANNNIFNGCFLGGTQVDQRNIFADYYAGGYNKYTSRQFQFDTGIDFDLASITKGLSFHFQFAVDYNTSYNTSYNNDYAVYAPTWSNYNSYDIITTLNKYGNDTKDGVQNISGSTDNQTIALSAHFDYNRTFNKFHNVSAMLIANGFQQTNSGVYHKTSNANLGLQLGYNYANKYFADFSGAAVHSAKLAEGHRNAFSPSLTLAWNIANEDFLKNSSIVDDLQIGLSGSILNQDIDIANYYMYMQALDRATGEPWGWYDGASELSANSMRGANEDLTFIKRKEVALNLRTSLWNKLITADVNFFINSTEGLLVQSSTLYPTYFTCYYPESSFVPYINYNNNRRTGIDFSVNFNKKVGEAEFSLGLNGTYYDTEATRVDETHADAYQYHAGKPIDGVWGLECEGFFATDEEAAAANQSFGGTLKAGDLKYKDQNNDGVIDSKDQIYLGKGGWYGSPLTLGLNFTAKWKGFTFFALATGGFGAIGMKSNSYWWVYGDGKYSEVVRNRWTPETAETATYPRLTTLAGYNNFSQNSTFWMYKTDRIDIAKLQLTYDLPKNLLNKTFISDASVYISGSNLFTISKEREYLEMNVGTAPQTRFYNLGVKLTF
ncbi:SusC/RagA family TonB-linked outer membrane protein [Bacteroides caecigallinarum]|uniref:SusC/RagA family TonB-linked outer membrane protein n=1 Tax=Bacteroides caecigallinarum TaxID=1411144 RepID=UPI001F15E40B|nr:SusC/RagA family TonB-linked outer membrane protein [Bacteroides caecigallinarum]MCF2582821.1 SusC/RagA family TonB-linked outer membrane protein [Bacteroides caecigallinarum]